MLKLLLAEGTERDMTFDTADSTNTMLDFTYTVAKGDVSAGLGFEANKLSTTGKITDAAATRRPRPSSRTMRVAASTSHKVDGVPPYVVSAALVHKTLTLTFNEALDSGSVAAKGDFTLKRKTADGTESNVGLATNNAVAVSGRTLTLTLATVVGGVSLMTVSYTKGAMSSPIQDAAGNAAANFKWSFGIPARGDHRGPGQDQLDRPVHRHLHVDRVRDRVREGGRDGDRRTKGAFSGSGTTYTLVVTPTSAQRDRDRAGGRGERQRRQHRSAGGGERDGGE